MYLLQKKKTIIIIAKFFEHFFIYTLKIFLNEGW
jgi:hypothetical protein